jgi:hypothetical protein
MFVFPREQRWRSLLRRALPSAATTTAARLRLLLLRLLLLLLLLRHRCRRLPQRMEHWAVPLLLWRRLLSRCKVGIVRGIGVRLERRAIPVGCHRRVHRCWQYRLLLLLWRIPVAVRRRALAIIPVRIAVAVRCCCCRRRRRHLLLLLLHELLLLLKVLLLLLVRGERGRGKATGAEERRRRHGVKAVRVGRHRRIEGWWELLLLLCLWWWWW